MAFEEKVSGKIPENVCVKLIEKYTAEQTELKEKSQKQINGATETQAPLIQINQQTNNIGAETSVDTMSRDSREKVKSAVMNVLKGLGVDGAVMSKPEDVIEVDTSTKEGE